MWGCSPSKQSSCDGLVEEIDDGVRGSVRGAGREIERDRELAVWCSSRRADWGAFYRRGEAVEEGGMVAGRSASFPAAIKGVWTRRGVAERRRDSRQQYRRRDGSAEAERHAGHPAARGMRGHRGGAAARGTGEPCPRVSRQQGGEGRRKEKGEREKGRKRKGGKGKRKEEKKKRRRRRDSRRRSRAGRGVDEKRRARETRRTWKV